MILETDVEKYFKKQVEKIGGLCLKFTSPGFKGVPDRLVLFRSRAYFLELKRPDGKPSALQLKRIKQIQLQDIYVDLIASKKEVDEFIETILSMKEGSENES